MRAGARTRLAMALGVLALSAATVLAVKLATQKTEVDQLFEILCGDDTADAAWAFEKLKEVGDESLRDFLPHIWSERVTRLHDLHWERVSESGSTGRRADPLQASQAARFVLVCRTGQIGELIDWELDRPRRGVPTWKEDIERLRRTRAGPDGFPLPSYPGKRRFLRFPEIRPPSQDARLAALAGDIDGLIDLIKSGSKAEARWALEVLSLLPDDTIEKLLQLAGNLDRTRVDHLSWNGGSRSRGDGFQVGTVVYFVLWSRAGGNATDLWEESTEARPGAPEKLSAMWMSYRKRKQPP